MKLSALDIRKQDFTRVVRGYDKDEVDAFLQLAANQWQELIDDGRREEEKVTELNVKLEHYQKVEEALEEALKTARVGAKKTIENAEHKAQLIIEEAEARAVEITREAENERLTIRKDAAKYSVRQKEIIAKLRAFLMSELEILAQYESEAPGSYIRLRPAERAERSGVAEDTLEDLRAKLTYDADTGRQVGSDDGEAEEPEPYEVAAAEPLDEPDHEAIEDEVDEDAEEIEIVAELTEQGESGDRERARASDAPPRNSSPRGRSKEPEVSDEIEKIRRILEDLEK